MTSKRKLLLTSFEPFGGESVNAAALAAAELPSVIGNFEIYKLSVPVVFGKCAAIAHAEAVRLNADCILSVGQAAGRAAVTPELAALNYVSAKSPDNEGNLPFDSPIIEGGREAYFSTLPARVMADAAAAAGISSSLSLSAGSYVCNDMFYRLLYMLHGTGVRVGFIHIPITPEQGSPSMTASTASAALAAAISAIDAQ